jgi:hypothetical protein
VRRAYDIHLCEFLEQALPKGRYPASPTKHLEWTDSEVLAMIRKAAAKSSLPGHDAARRIGCRQHFKVLYERTPADVLANESAGRAVYRAACEEFGEASVRHDPYGKEGSRMDFPVLRREDDIVSSWDLSQTLQHIPPAVIDFVFVDPERREEAAAWLAKNHTEIISSGLEKEQP